MQSRLTFKEFNMTQKDRRELKLAALLHDCGKITTPVHVIEKATKLETIIDRICLVDTRFEVLKRDAEIAFLRDKLDLIENNAKAEDIDQLTKTYENKVEELNDEIYPPGKHRW